MTHLEKIYLEILMESWRKAHERAVAELARLEAESELGAWGSKSWHEASKCQAECVLRDLQALSTIQANDNLRKRKERKAHGP